MGYTHMVNEQFQGLANPRADKDACGICTVADVHGKKSHKTDQQGLEMLANLEHRGACGCDPLTGDGAGILFQIPHEFFKKVGPKKLPAPDRYAVGMVFLPAYPSDRE